MNATAYYNENDEFAANWLRNLIATGLIAPGVVDTRSIVDVRPGDLDGFTQCHFFAGIGGWSLALRLAGWPDDRPVWTGSCPCQPFSVAGKRGGFDDERHLWPVWFNLIRQRRPATVFGEQVASATEWLRLVRSDLEALDYAVGAMPIQAASAGADHLRDRYWFVADAGSGRLRGPSQGQTEQPRRTEIISASETGESSDVGLADTDESCKGQGRQTESERADQRLIGPDGLADSDESCKGQGRQQRGREFGGTSGNPQPRDSGNVADSMPYRDGTATGESLGAQRTSEHSRGREASRSVPSARIDGSDFEWVIGADGKARRVGSDFRVLVDGLRAGMGGLRTDQIAAAFNEVINYGAQASLRPAEVLQAVWNTVLSEPAPYEAMGKQAGISQAEILLTLLCELHRRSGATDIPPPSEEEFRAAVRSVRQQTAPARTSYRRRHHEQRTIKHSNPLQILSWVLAQHAQALWTSYRQTNAAPMALLASGQTGRVGKLRGFGNAIDPRPAAEFIGAYLDVTTAAVLIT